LLFSDRTSGGKDNGPDTEEKGISLKIGQKQFPLKKK